MKIIQRRKDFFFLSFVLVASSILFLFFWGLKPGIDFTGGTLIEISGAEGVEISQKKIEKNLSELELSSLVTQSTEDGKWLIRFSSEDDEAGQKAQEKLSAWQGIEIQRVEFISSTISSELKETAVVAVILAIVAVAAYIAWAFRGVSFPVKSWVYGLGAVVALAHDILITLGVFAWLGKFYQIEVGVPFVAALLTILGYSVNDTIVVFDRVRENLKKGASGEKFETVVNDSIRETLGRSINTSLTVILVLTTIILLGGGDIKYFALALLVGVFFGTYSSIFVASALVVEVWARNFEKRRT